MSTLQYITPSEWYASHRVKKDTYFLAPHGTVVTDDSGDKMLIINTSVKIGVSPDQIAAKKAIMYAWKYDNQRVTKGPFIITQGGQDVMFSPELGDAAGNNAERVGTMTVYQSNESDPNYIVYFQCAEGTQMVIWVQKEWNLEFFGQYDHSIMRSAKRM